MLQRYFVLFTILLISIQVLKAQPDSTTVFPNDWEGHWKGDLEIWKGSGLVQTINMELIIDCKYESKDSCEWGIVYGADSSDMRMYLIKTIDKANGKYVIDERNSIFLDDYLIGGKLISLFKVGASLITATYELKGDALHFEILASNDQNVTISGGNEEEENNKTPSVTSYPILVRQYAILKK